MTIEIKKSVKPIEYKSAIDILEDKLEQIKINKGNELIWVLEHEEIYTGGTSSNLLWQTPFWVQNSPAYNKNTGEFSQDFTDVPAGGPRHRVAVHEDYVSGPFQMQERDFSTGSFQDSAWTYKNTITFNVNSNAQGQVYHIMEYGAVTASGGDQPFEGQMRCKYRIKSA